MNETLGNMLKYINRNFVVRCDSVTSIVADGVLGSFVDYVVGQYVYIRGSLLNDGVYKITAVSTSKLTLDEALTAEATSHLKTVYGLGIPKALLALAVKIGAHTQTAGIASESIDDYSVSYTDSSWAGAYAKELQSWRVPFSDLGGSYVRPIL